MKEQTGIIGNSCFNRTVQGYTSPLFSTTFKLIRAEAARLVRRWLPTIIAGSGIALILLTGIYLFLIQLAEHGL